MPLLISVAISSVFIPKTCTSEFICVKSDVSIGGFSWDVTIRRCDFWIAVAFHHTLRVKQEHAPGHRHHEGHAGLFISAMWLYF